MKSVAYIRWSSDDQTSGDSLNRQTANVSAYCERVGLTLDQTIIDDGFSAFKGHHISKGALGRFLIDADKGKYQGFALVVEHIDRLSRQGIDETSNLLRRLLKAGIVVHVTQENRVIQSLDDLTTAILNVVQGFAAQEYAKKLRERVGNAWNKKKHNGTNGVAITNKLPGWLDGKTGEQITVNEQKAAVVRRIFEMAANGMGKRLIARVLNSEGVPTFGGGPRRNDRWIQSYVHKVLNNRAVLGEYQPRKNRIADGEVRTGFYPAVVDHALFQKAQASLRTRRVAFHGRTGMVNSLFTSLVWDVTSDNPLQMHYADKGKKDRPRLVTDTDRKELRHSIVYAEFEIAFLHFLDQLDWTSVLDVAESAELQTAEKEIVSYAENIAKLEQQIEKLTDLLIDTPSASLKQRLLDAEKRLQDAQSSRSVAEAKLDDLRKRHQDMLDSSVVFLKLVTATDIETRAKLREEIRRKVRRIEIHFGDETTCRIEFVNGVLRYAKFMGTVKKEDGWSETTLKLFSPAA